LKEKDHIAQVSSMSGGGSRGSNPAYTYAASQNQQQQYIPQKRDENSFWGWDLSMMDTADFQIDWTGLEGWQP